MMLCPKCKITFDDSKKFCQKCGSTLVVERVAAPEPQVKAQGGKKLCPKCKIPYDESKTFCQKCGSSLVMDQIIDPEVFAKTQFFKNRLTQEPNNRTLMIEYGDFLASISSFDEALIQYFTALEMDANDYATRRKVIEIYRKKENWEKLINQMAILIKNQPENVVLLDELARIYISLGRKEEAETTLSKMASLDPGNIKILLLRRDFLKDLGKDDEVVTICKNIVEIQPSELSTWKILGDIYLKKRLGEDAYKAFEKILSLEPNNARANLYVGMSYIGIAQHAESAFDSYDKASKLILKAFNNLTDLSPEENSLATLYHCYLELKLGRATMDITNALRNVNASHLDKTQTALLAESFLLKGEMERKAGKLDDAIVSLEASIKVSDSPEARKQLAEIYAVKGDAALGRGDANLSAADYGRALKYQPEDKTVQTKYNQVISKQKKKKSIGAAAMIGGGVAIAAIIAIGVYFFMIKPNIFVKQIEQALNEGRLYSPPGNNVAELYRAKKNEDPNSKVVQDAAAKIRQHIEPLGEASIQKFYSDSNDSDWANTISMYNLLIELFPNDNELKAKSEFCLGHNIVSGREKKNYSEALSHFQKALELKPNWVLPVNGIAKIYVRKDSPYFNEEEAMKYYVRASELDSSFPWPLMNIAGIYERNKQWDMAEQYLLKAKQIKSNNPSIYTSLGNMCYMQKKMDEAKNYYQEALKYEQDQEKVVWLQKKIEALSGIISQSNVPVGATMPVAVPVQPAAPAKKKAAGY